MPKRIRPIDPGPPAVDGWRMLAADVIGKAVEEYRGSRATPRWKRTVLKARWCAYCNKIFRADAMYCSTTCWELSQDELRLFFAGDWFEELAELAGIHPDVVRKNLVKPVMPKAWKRVDLAAEVDF